MSAVVVLAALAAGCESPAGLVDLGPPAPQIQPIRSLALDTPRLRRLAGGEAADGLPWYAARRDAVPSVIAGYASPVLERSVTWTIDRQRITHGRVIDQVWSTTYRTRTHQAVR
ncbi:MAG TPA: hypothetical protein VF184_01810 [Phycisphaeraceae bacterium]